MRAPVSASKRRPPDLASLAEMLHRHHPEAVPDPAAFVARARAEQEAPPVARVDEAFELELEERARGAVVARGRTEAEIDDDFLAGRGALSVIGAVALPEDLQDAFKEEVLALRASLIRAHGPEPDTIMACDTAATAFFEARYLGMLARTVLRAGLDSEHVKRAQCLDEMSSRAHRRALNAVELLRRPHGASVRIQIGEAKNVAVGDQKVELAT